MKHKMKNVREYRPYVQGKRKVIYIVNRVLALRIIIKPEIVWFHVISFIRQGSRVSFHTYQLRM